MGEPVMGCLACAGTETGFPGATHPGAAAFPFLRQETLGLGCGAWSPSLLSVATWVVCTQVSSAGWRPWVWSLLGHGEDGVSPLFFPLGSLVLSGM